MFHPFFKLRFFFNAGKSYLFELNRIWNVSPEKLKKYQDKMLRKSVKYAYTVPIYRKIYDEHDIHPRDIKGIEDIGKLPLISKDDIKNGYPNDIVPKNVNKNDIWLMKTSGSSGNPFSFYRSTCNLLRDTIYSIREFRIGNTKWKNEDRITNMGSHSSPEKYDYVIQNAVTNNLKFLISDKNRQDIEYFFKDSKRKIQEINKFKPNIMMGLPEDMRIIAYLKRNGYGKDINPTSIFTCGGMLDDYKRKYIEDTFKCKIIDVYGSAEVGYIASQCKDGNYHVYSDIVYVEVVDDDGKPVASGKPGHIVVTKLLPGGTPFIRYTGLDDIVTPLHKKCSCGLNTSILKHVEGKVVSRIFFPDGSYITPDILFKGINETINKFNTSKIARYQIIQENLYKILILIIIDEKQKDLAPNVDMLFNEIKKQYQKIFDKDVKIEVKEVKKVLEDNNPYKPAPLIISKVKNKTDKL